MRWCCCFLFFYVLLCFIQFQLLQLNYVKKYCSIAYVILTQDSAFVMQKCMIYLLIFLQNDLFILCCTNVKLYFIERNFMLHAAKYCVVQFLLL